jgi:hypothetical protein
VTVAVQQRVVGADGDANGGRYEHEAFLLAVAGECNDDEDDDGHWWPLLVAVGGRKTRGRSGRYRSGRR